MQGGPAECIAEYVRRASAGERQGAGNIPGLEFESIALLGEGPHRSGERGTLRLGGTWTERNGSARSYELSFKIKSLQSGQRVYETWSPSHGIKLTETGRFELLADLQFNLPDGVYQVETWVSNGESGIFVGDGPMLQILVEKGPPFSGQVQMNPRLSLAQGQ